MVSSVYDTPGGLCVLRRFRFLHFSTLSSVTTDATMIQNMKFLAYGQLNRPLFFHISHPSKGRDSLKLIENRLQNRGGCRTCACALRNANPCEKLFRRSPIGVFELRWGVNPDDDQRSNGSDARCRKVRFTKIVTAQELECNSNV